MELFTLGEGNGYTEHDVREQARALTGWTSTWKRGKGQTNFRFDPKRHDAGTKTMFGKKGAFAWRDAVVLCLHHPKHPAFFVTKLWSYFVPSHPTPARRQALERLYTSSGFEVRPVLEAILRHPALYTGPRMVKPPVVYIAGLLRGLGRGIDTSAWVWLAEGAGQRLFYPPNVAGWDDSRWLDTNTFRGRWSIANEALEKFTLEQKKGTSHRRCRTTPRRSSRPRWRCSGTRRSVRRPTRRSSPSRAARSRARPAGRRRPIRHS